MWEWFWFIVPWELKLAVFAVIGILVYLFAVATFGADRVNRYIVPAVILVVTLGLVNKFQQEGWKAKAARDMREADKAIERAKKARETAVQHNSDPDNLRKDDGYRRD